MTRLLTALFLFITISARATGTFTLLTPPCNHDGVLSVNYAPSTSSLIPPYTVTWQYPSGISIIHSGVTDTTDTLTGFSGASVTVTVTDAIGVAITMGSYEAPPFTVNITSTSEACPTPDTITATVSGGTPPFSYQWVSTASGAIVSTSNPSVLPSNKFYTLTVTDAVGCVYGAPDIDSNVFAPVAAYDVIATTTPASCTNGTASVAYLYSTLTPPYTYLWSNGATTPSIGSLTTGLYHVTVTDVFGCQITAYGFVEQSITISVPITTTPTTCINSDGAVAAFGSGGVPPYSYLWSNGATTATQTGIAAGEYDVTVTDANGCIGMGYANVITSTPIDVTYTSTPSSCTAPTGTSTLNITGGTAPYSIVWYTTPVQTTITATGLIAGDYSFRVTDATGCERTGTAHVPPIHIISPNFSDVPPLCASATGSIATAPTGGTTPYSYLWNTGSTASSLTGISAGYYTVTITDAAGCSINKLFILNAYSPLLVGITPTQESCFFSHDGVLAATPVAGTPPYTYHWWPTGGTSATATGLAHGCYTVSVSDAAGCTVSRYSYLPYDSTTDYCYCTIQGTVYNDANNNCIQDAGEAGIPDIQMYCSSRGYTYTDAAGHYSFKVPSGTDTIRQTILSYYPLASCQANNIVVSATAASGCVHTIDFADTTYPIHDMKIRSWDYNFPVVGQAYHRVAILKNRGTITEPGILASYEPDGQLLEPTFVPSGIFTGSPYYYNTASGFPALAPGAGQTFYMNYSVPTNIPMGTNVVFKDSVAHQAPMDNWLDDYSPWDNVEYVSTTVVASYDPNFKEVYPKGTGAFGSITTDDSVLEYMVHFQNTGTSPAINVVVVDTLDNNLEWTSLQPSYESAPCKITLEQVGAYKIATFAFYDINLPAQTTDDFRSNGMFSYTIKQKAGLVAGDQMRNSASIYFDYNAPVKTNTTINTIGTPTAVSNPTTTAANAEAAFSVYPNPAASVFYVRISSDMATTGSMKVTDITGKVLISKSVDLTRGSQTIATEINDFAAGIYFVSLTANGKTNTQKLVVIR